MRLNQPGMFVAVGAALMLASTGCSDPARPPLPPTLTDDSQSAQAFSGTGPVETTEAFSVKHKLVVAWEFGGCSANVRGQLTVQVQASADSGDFRTIVDHVGVGNGQVIVDHVANRALSLKMLNPGLCTWRVRMWPSN